MEDVKTTKRIDINKEIIFSAMKTIVPEGYLEKVIHGASGPGLIQVLDRQQNDIFLRQVKPEEIKTKYQLVEGRNDLYELRRPKCTNPLSKFSFSDEKEA